MHDYFSKAIVLIFMCSSHANTTAQAATAQGWTENFSSPTCMHH